MKGEAQRTEPDTVVLSACCATAAMIIATVFLRCREGYDFTDEGCYLNAMATPWLYRATATQYGFVYHPLWLLTGGSLVLLRRANLLITLALAFGASSIFVCSRSINSRPSSLRNVAFSFALSSVSVAFLSPWLPTPNYNTLAFQSLLLATLGLLLLARERPGEYFLGYGIWGFSLALAFLAKPSTALALGVASLCWVVVSKNFRMKPFVIAALVFTFALLIAAILIEGSPVAFVARLQMGAADLRLLDTHYSLRKILRNDPLNLSRHEELLLLSTCVVIAAVAAVLAATSRIRWIATTLSVALLGYSILGIAGISWNPPVVRPLLGLHFLAVQAAGALTLAFQRFRTSGVSPPNVRWGLMLLLTVLPFAFVYGTNSNYWENMPTAGFFWVLAALEIGRLKPGTQTVPSVGLLAGSLMVTAAVLASSMFNPYRQPLPLSAQAYDVSIGPSVSTVLVDRDSAHYIGSLKELAARAGFLPGMPMLDLTGRSPGAVYALAAESIGRPWMIGGYRGSNALAEAAISRVPAATLAAAWVLIESDGPRALDPVVLLHQGLHWPEHYQLVATIRSPPGIYSRQFEQKLYRPATD